VTNETGKHAAKHGKKQNVEISPYDLKIQFSPELREQLQDVIEAVRYSPHFDDKHNLFGALNSFAGGTDALMTMRLMKDITLGIEAHTKATGDYKAWEAWDEFSMQLIDPPRGKTPFTLIQEQQGKQKG
jgi:hypothetical protein